MSTGKSRSVGRWWEVYVVRYAMGTIVGALISYIICLKSPADSPLKKFVLTSTLDATQLGLFAAFGLVFCYVSNAPILVLHASRFMFRYPLNGQSIRSASCRTSWLLTIAVIMATVIYLVPSTQENVQRLLGAAGFFLLVLIILPQFYLILSAIRDFGKCYDFYKKLAWKRSKEATDIIDSYRHLREHGNSFLILLMEISFGIILCAIQDPETGLSRLIGNVNGVTISIVTLWILPAAIVWFLGAAIEFRFAHD